MGTVVLEKKMIPEVFMRIEAGYFVAGVVAVGGRVTKAAPIIHYMVGWKVEKVRRYCDGMKWKVWYGNAEVPITYRRHR